jgi:hypothetical protein
MFQMMIVLYEHFTLAHSLLIFEMTCSPPPPTLAPKLTYLQLDFYQSSDQLF